MKKFLSILTALTICCSLLCGCGAKTEKTNNPLVENPEDRLEVTQQIYRDLSFLSREQRAFVEEHTATLEALAFDTYPFYKDFIGDDAQYIHKDKTSFAVTNRLWQDFYSRMLNIVTEDYLALLVKNNHFAEENGKLAVGMVNNKTLGSEYTIYTDNYIVKEFTDSKVVFERERYYFDALSGQNQSADRLYEMAVFNTKFSFKDITTFCLVNTRDGWRTGDFYRRDFFRAGTMYSADHLADRCPADNSALEILPQPTPTAPEVVPIYNQQIEAEQLTRCLVEAIKSIDPSANTVVFDHHSLILQLATVNDKYFAYNNFAPVTPDGERMFSADECEKLLDTVLGVTVDCKSLFNEHNYVMRSDMYVNPTFVERLTDYSCENLQFSVAGSGLDCSVKFDLVQHNTTFDNKTYKGTFVFKYNLVPAENHWRFAGFEMV